MTNADIQIGELEELRAEVATLREENNSLAMQLGHAFEELTLLQQLGTQLALSNHSETHCGVEPASITERFDGILDQVLGVIEAQSLVLLTTHTETELEYSTGDPLTLQQCESIIGELAGSDARSLIICNEPASPEIQHRMLVKLSSDGQQWGWLLAVNRVGMSAHEGFTSIEGSFVGNVASMIAVHLHNTRLLAHSQTLFADMVHALVSAVDARDPYTCGHSERVAMLTRQLAQVAGMSPVECQRLYYCGLLHDVGKIAVPDAILRKQERLSPEEREVMDKHPENGWKILSNVTALNNILPSVLHHHEAINGEGYPHQLKGADIPVEARLLAICDSYDAMTSDRPYRKGMPPQKAAAVLRETDGQWDPELVQLFLDNLDRMVEITQNHIPSTTFEEEQ